MPTDGWYRQHRSLFTHPLFEGDEFCRGHAFSDLIGMAEFEAGERGIKGHIVKLERGQLFASVRFLANRWKWSKGKVQRYLARLEVERMVFEVRSETDTPDGTPIGTVYRIANYDTYQSRRDTERDASRDTDGTPTGQIERKKELTTTTTTGASVSNEADGEKEQAKLEMWADFDRRADGLSSVERTRAEGLVRGIIDGDTATAWQTPEGAIVPWPDRPRLMRMALDERAASNGKIFNVLRQLVIPREFDAFKQTKSTDERARKPQVQDIPVNRPLPEDVIAADLQRLKTQHPELYAEELAAFERTSWWTGPTVNEDYRILQLRNAMKEKLAKPRIVA